jgi:peptidoglycan hydrolase-like protein with peptidoglycan-binding domain
MSHGCVNLAPLDAKWVFFYADPPIYEGYHGNWSSDDRPGSMVVVQVADGAEAFVGGLLGGAIGSAIVNQQQQRRVVVQPRTTTRRAPAPSVNTYQREENRTVQTALNYFGFPSGTPDGVMGPNSRAAAGQYQAYMGYPATGYLTDYERTFLTSSYNRAVIGGPQIGQMVAAQGQGTRGLLQAFRQEQMGVPVATAPMPVAPQPVAVPQVVAPTVEAAAPAPAPAPEAAPAAVAAAAPAMGLPSFMPDSASVSMNSFCNRVNLSTSASGGFVTLASMDDPYQALGEQFCLARTHAIEQGDSLAGTVQGFSMAEIQAQCEAFAPSMWEYQARLATQSSDEVAGALQDFVVAIGAPPVQLSGNARICLGVGYRTDNAELALAAAQMLVGLGEEAYGELLGHHLLNGFAAPKREDRGLEWLTVATGALDAGAAPLVPVGSDARAGLLQQAIATINGTEPPPVLQDASATVPAPAFVLPTGKPQRN